MEIDTQYAVRLFFPASSFVQVYFEAVANALDAGATEISIAIAADGRIDPENLVVTISDNGVGLTDDRFDRFSRLQEPVDAYHKGLGRLVFLQYFKRVHVSSRFAGGSRRFVFSNDFDGSSERGSATEGGTGTTLRFEGFAKDRLKAYDDVKPESVKQELIDHFLPVLHQRRESDQSFRISISLDTDQPNPQYDFYSDTATITATDIPQFNSVVLQRPEFGAFGEVHMSYSIREAGSSSRIHIAASIDGRAVPMNLLNPRAVPAGKSATFLFDSPIFQGASDSARQRIMLPTDLPEADFFHALRDEIASVLSRELPEIETRNASTRRHFEESYPHLVGLFNTDTVGLVDREVALKEAQWQFFDKQRDVLEGRSAGDEAYRKSLELSARTLLEYVLYREFIIQRLKAVSAEDKEEAIHSLIVPRFRTFEGNALTTDVYSNNAWILDDKFMSFRTILSEARMEEIIQAISLTESEIRDETRPDISMIFSADPANVAAVDVVVVEVKRRGMDDKDGPYAATQLLKRARKLVNHCHNIERMWYFGILDIDEDIAQLLQDAKWTPLFSRGHVFYQDYKLERGDGKKVLAPTCLISFEAVVKDAEARNHTFLELLKADVREALAAQVKS